MALLPNAQIAAGLDAQFVAGTVYYLSLHTATTGTTGAAEVTGGSYVRQAITFAATSGATKISSGADAAQSFTGMPAEAGGCPYAGVWTLATGGTFLGGLTTSGLSGAISVGATITFAAGATVWTGS
jgi:hypothetical protein